MLIDKKTDGVIWTVGGNRDNFVELAPLNGADSTGQLVLTMRWQHHERYVPETNETQPTLFNNYVKETSHC